MTVAADAFKRSVSMFSSDHCSARWVWCKACRAIRWTEDRIQGGRLRVTSTSIKHRDLLFRLPFCSFLGRMQRIASIWRKLWMLLVVTEWLFKVFYQDALHRTSLQIVLDNLQHAEYPA